MNELPWLAGLAVHHRWAEREYARLHADAVEARLAARARSVERASRRRAALRDRIAALLPARKSQPVPYCARAAGHSATAVRMAGGVR